MTPDPKSAARDQVRLDRRAWAQFERALCSFARSEAGGRAGWLLGALIALMLALNALNVVNSYVGRDFMTAIERRSMHDFIAKALIYVAVFGASTVAAVLLRFSEERLALLWREWLTRSLIDRYLARGSFYRLREQGEIGNPDQRIAEDVRAFTTTTVSFLLLLLNGTLTIVAFSGVLWSISPRLFAVAVLYAGAGSVLTVWLGRPLVWLSYHQSDKEASFRADLVHVRENAEAIVYMGGDRRVASRLSRRLADLVGNVRRIIAVNRNLGFFTTGYNYLIQIIPALVVAPLFIRGEVEFGVIPQSAMAFSHLLGAFSLIVTQFQSISSYAAAGMRLGALSDAAERAALPGASPIEIEEEAEELTYRALVLRSPLDERLLIDTLDLAVPAGVRLLVSGPNETAKLALFRATAGIWEAGSGRILRPACDELMFLPERPYLSPGSLRQVLARRGAAEGVAEERIALVLKNLGLEPVLERVGDLDVERDWQHVLSLSEQQLLGVARIALAAPRFALLHRIGTTLTAEQVARALRVLWDASVTYVTLGECNAGTEHHDALLEIAAEGAWTFQPLVQSTIAS